MNDRESVHAREAIASTARAAGILLMILFGVYCVSGVYSVDPAHLGVHTRFGQVLDGAVQPGIHFGMPWPFDTVYRVAVKKVQTVVIDDFAVPADREGGAAGFALATGLTPYSITGDNNIVNVELVVQYMVVDASGYLFGAAGPEQILKEAAKSAIVTCMAGMTVDTVLTNGKRDMARFVMNRLNDLLSNAGTGLAAQFVEIRSISPPEMVQKHFDDVINASIDRRMMVSKAEGYRNQRLSAANAEAVRRTEQALAYRATQTAMASGDSQRFLQRLGEYEKDPATVRDNLYFGFISDFSVGGARKMVLDSEGPEGSPLDIRLFWPR